MEEICMSELILERLFKPVIREIQNLSKEGRELKITPGTIGITTLIRCPQQAKLRLLYPEMKPDTLEIDDGYLHEKITKQAILNVYPKNTLIEPAVPENPIEVENVLIQGHPDVVIEGKKAIIAIEIKCMNFLPGYRLPSQHEKFIYGEDAKRLIIPEQYIIQARAQKYLLSLKADKQVIQYLFIKALVKINGRMKKYYVIRQVEDALREEEIRFYARKHATQSSPIWDWECAYCTFNQEGLCERAVKPAPRLLLPETLPEDVRNAIERLQELRREMKDLESYLKKALYGKKVIITKDGKEREIGWVAREVARWDVEGIIKKLGIKSAQYLRVNWRRTRQLEEALREETESLREMQTVIDFKI